LKGLYGETNLLKSFISNFKKKIIENVEQMPGGFAENLLG
jgi:hypothetical protein